MNKNTKKDIYIIISTGRAASTTVYNYIKKRKTIQIPLNKEPHHFINIYVKKGLYKLIQDIYVANFDEYIKLYDNSPIILDASVGYFFYIDEFIENIKKNKLNPKVIYLYREPKSRLSSMMNELSKKGLIEKNIKNFLDEDFPTDFWWEYHKDNVPYLDVFNKLVANFSKILAIDYLLLENNPSFFFKSIDDFVELENKDIVEEHYLNSSLENYLFKRTGKNFRGKHRIIKLILRHSFLRSLANYFFQDQIKPFVNDVHVKNSLDQYKKLRSIHDSLVYIDKKDKI